VKLLMKRLKNKIYHYIRDLHDHADEYVHVLGDGEIPHDDEVVHRGAAEVHHCIVVRRRDRDKLIRRPPSETLTKEIMVNLY